MAPKRRNPRTVEQRLDAMEKLLKLIWDQIRPKSTQQERTAKRMETLRKKRIAEREAEYAAHPERRPSPEITAHVDRMFEHHRQRDLAKRLGGRLPKFPRLKRAGSPPDSKGGK